MRILCITQFTQKASIRPMGHIVNYRNKNGPVQQQNTEVFPILFWIVLVWFLFSCVHNRTFSHFSIMWVVEECYVAKVSCHTFHCKIRPKPFKMFLTMIFLAFSLYTVFVWLKIIISFVLHPYVFSDILQNIDNINNILIYFHRLRRSLHVLIGVFSW